MENEGLYDIGSGSGRGPITGNDASAKSPSNTNSSSDIVVKRSIEESMDFEECESVMWRKVSLDCIVIRK